MMGYFPAKTAQNKGFGGVEGPYKIYMVRPSRPIENHAEAMQMGPRHISGEPL
jgi:hypothetical protein